MYAAALLWRSKFSVFPNSGQPETRWSKVLSNGHRICILPKSLSSSPPPPPLFSSLYSKLTCYCCTCTCTYPVVNERWGATDVATLSLHFILFSASLTAWQNFNPVHSAMLFSQRFFCRPLLLPPCTVPCKIVLASPDDLDTCPNHFNLRFLTVVKISS